MHKAFGYEKHNSFKDFGLLPPEGELDSYILSVDGIYEHMVKDKPFFDFVITYSAHLPYEGESKKLALAKQLRPDLVNTKMNLKMNNALILASDTDKFFEMLMQRLEKDGILEDTVIIGFTDHFAYGLYDDELVDMLKGENQYKVPAFVYNKGTQPMVVDKPCMTIDMAPTIANLFGLKVGTDYIGNDILSPQNEGFVFLQNGDWIDKNMYYNHKKPPKDIAKKQYITDMCNKARTSISINDKIVLGDYYKQ
jgi:phosphoglycerol transferase MdoB-like AlkP superfamily enzyme